MNFESPNHWEDEVGRPLAPPVAPSELELHVRVHRDLAAIRLQVVLRHVADVEDDFLWGTAAKQVANALVRQPVADLAREQRSWSACLFMPFQSFSCLFTTDSLRDLLEISWRSRVDLKNSISRIRAVRGVQTAGPVRSQ